MNIEKVTDRRMGANCYLVSDGSRAIIIDSTADLRKTMAEKKLDLVGVFITHGHFDHLGMLNIYAQSDNVLFYMHKKGYEKLQDPLKNCSVYFDKQFAYDLNPNRTVFVHDGETLSLLRTPITVFGTPGHTDCSICIAIEENLFTGDTLFQGSVGRTDLYSSDEVKMLESVNRLKNLKINYRIFPGHGEETMLEYEKTNNPFLNR
jgi:glyoxylase-like metal-dependent hydrolase (beta-lactamase superfamily II)